MNTSRQQLEKQAGIATQLGGQASRYGTLADYAANNYGVDDPAMRTATQNEVNYLQQDPNTNQADAQYLADATRGTDAAFQRGNADLTASLTSRGFTGPSSMLTGGLTSLPSRRRRRTPPPRMVSPSTRSPRRTRTAGASSVSIPALPIRTTATRPGALGAETGALGSEAGQYGSIAHSYGTLGQYEQGQQDKQNAAQAQMWGNIGQSVGGAIDGQDTSLQDAQVALLNAQAAALANGQNPSITPLSAYAPPRKKRVN